MTASDYHCDVCSGPTSRAPRSGGREYYCPSCHEYYACDLDRAPGAYAMTDSEHRERDRDEEVRLRLAVVNRLAPFEELGHVIVRSVREPDDDRVHVTVTLSAEKLAESLETLRRSRDWWESRSGEWKEKEAWRERAISAEDKIRVLTTPRDVWTEDQG